jgi:hypothetical protein
VSEGGSNFRDTDREASNVAVHHPLWIAAWLSFRDTARTVGVEHPSLHSGCVEGKIEVAHHKEYPGLSDMPIGLVKGVRPFTSTSANFWP